MLRFAREGGLVFAPVRIEIRASNQWILIKVSLHLFAIVVLFYTGLELMTRLILGVGVLLSAGFLIRLPLNEGVKTLILNPDEPGLATLDKRGRYTRHRFPRAFFVFRYLICIRLEACAPVPDQWLVFLPDMMHPADWRRLSVIARWVELER